MFDEAMSFAMQEQEMAESMALEQASNFEGMNPFAMWASYEGEAFSQYQEQEVIAESFVDDMISNIPVVGSTLVDAVDGVEDQERDFEDEA